jgi:hypothetical protein
MPNSPDPAHPSPDPIIHSYFSESSIHFYSIIQVIGWTLFVLLFYAWNYFGSGINLAGHFSLWLLGLLGIWFSMNGLQKSCRERDKALR